MKRSSAEGPGGFQAFAEQRMARFTTPCSGRTIWSVVSAAGGRLRSAEPGGTATAMVSTWRSIRPAEGAGSNDS